MRGLLPRLGRGEKGPSVVEGHERLLEPRVSDSTDSNRIILEVVDWTFCGPERSIGIFFSTGR